MAEEKKVNVCNHCQRQFTYPYRGRRLCWPCHQKPEIRDLYTIEQYALDRRQVEQKRDVTARMTEAELDAFIEARRATMPTAKRHKGHKGHKGVRRGQKQGTV